MRRNLENEAADHCTTAGSNVSRGNKSLRHKNADQEIAGEKRSYSDKRLVNDRDVHCRCFSDNTPHRNSFKDSSATKRSKSESEVDIEEESADQQFFVDETLNWNHVDKRQSEKENENGCEKCQRFCNGNTDNRVICTAL